MSVFLKTPFPKMILCSRARFLRKKVFKDKFPFLTLCQHYHHEVRGEIKKKKEKQDIWKADRTENYKETLYTGQKQISLGILLIKTLHLKENL